MNSKTMLMVSRVTLGATFGAMLGVMIATQVVRAEDLVFGAPMRDIALAGEREVSLDSTQLFMRLSVTARHAPVSRDKQSPLRLFDSIQGRITGEMALSPRGPGPSLPYFDFEGVPYVIGTSSPGGTGNGVRLVPMEMSRYFAINEDWALRLDLIGAQSSLRFPLTGYGPNPGITAIVNMSADTLGYRGVRRLVGADGKEDGSLHGIHLAASVTEVGLDFRILEMVRSRLLLGMRTDTTFGKRDDDEWKISIRDKFYAMIAADLQDYAETYKLSLFTQVSKYVVFEKDVPRANDLQFIFGAAGRY